MTNRLGKLTATGLVAAALAATPVLAQTQGAGSQGSGTNYSTETRQDNNRDWGWLGLLGLLGLLALRRKHNDDTVIRRDNMGRP